MDNICGSKFDSWIYAELKYACKWGHKMINSSVVHKVNPKENIESTHTWKTYG